MKKIFTLACIFLSFAGVALAQSKDDTFQFVDKDGNVVADGSTLTLTEVEDDGFGGLQILSGLSVRNSTSNEAYVGMNYAIESLPHGSLSCCFPSMCVDQTKTGSYVTGVDKMSANETRNMLTEWKLADDGGYATCKATFQLEHYSYNAVTRKYTLIARGNTVAVNFVYADPAGIAQLSTSAAVVYYDLQGRQLKTEPEHGLYIKQKLQTDGKVITRKVMKP